MFPTPKNFLFTPVSRTWTLIQKHLQRAEGAPWADSAPGAGRGCKGSRELRDGVNTSMGKWYLLSSPPLFLLGRPRVPNKPNLDRGLFPPRPLALLSAHQHKLSPPTKLEIEKVPLFIFIGFLIFLFGGSWNRGNGAFLGRRCCWRWVPARSPRAATESQAAAVPADGFCAK